MGSALESMKRILIVDDDALLRDLIALQFPAGEYKVDTAANGYEALTLAEDTGYDLIISDICMPGMDGLTFVKNLRQLGNQTPIIVISGSPTARRAFQGLQVIGPINKMEIGKSLEDWRLAAAPESKSSS